ncbi:cell adhesion molecule Dscam1-like isoform X2 [Dermacentor albipictus]|uniref:cell adhesion molecule Dscam1-like isoform X2 n=1 Tax=Dermacentor albipictus TaxID=60249 RepID=UPI0031FDFF23
MGVVVREPTRPVTRRSVVLVSTVLLLAGGLGDICHALEAPEMHKMYVDSNLKLGDGVDLMCSLKRGSAPVHFAWYHNGREIRAEDKLGDVVSLQGKSILVVREISRDHIGNYTCSVRNPAGSDSYTVKLYVDVKPIWTKEPEDASASTGSNIVIHCNAFGYPVPRIEWSKEREDRDFELVRMGDRFNMAPNGSLQIRSVKAEDGGHYRCDVSNGLGNGISKIISVAISTPPRILERVEETTVRRSHSVRLKCEATGDRPLAVHWFKDQRPYQATLREGFDIIERSLPGGVISELLIQNSSTSDTGAYVCKVSNKFGNVTSLTKLYVLEPPSPPVSIKISDIRSRTVRLTWQAPYSEVSTFHVRFWKENSQSRKLTLITVSGSETFVYLSDLLPGTSYGGYLLSENRVGMSAPSTSLHFTTSEEAPTAPPLDIRVVGLGSTHVKIEWKAPPKEHQNGKIQGYHVGHRAYDSPMLPYTYQTVTGVDATQAALRALRPNTRYAAVVQTFNSAGPSPSSHQLDFTTLEEDLPVAPVFSVSSVTCCSATFTIKERKRRSLTQYVLDYRERGGYWRSVYFPAHAHTLSLDSLSRTTPYEVVLSAYNMYGRGDPSDPVLFETTGEQPLPQRTDEGTRYLLNSRIIGPVIASLLIIFTSIAVAWIFYKKITSPEKEHPIIYQSATLPKHMWPDQEYATIARTTIRRRVEEAYDVPWDMEDVVECPPKVVEDCYTLLKKKVPGELQRVPAGHFLLDGPSCSMPDEPPVEEPEK